MHVVHPVADEWTEEYVVWAARTRRVLLTTPLATFLDVARTDRVRPVLATNGNAEISPLVSLAMRRVGGHWAVRTADGVFDGLSGYRVDCFEDLWRRSGTDRDRLPGYGRSTPDGVGVVMFDVYSHARAAGSTTVGGLAQSLVENLVGSPLSTWGPHEPLLEPWDVDDLTAAARAGMPVTGALHALGDGSFADVTAARTRHGVLEQAKGGVVSGPYSGPVEDLVARASQALTAVAGRFRPTIGFVSLAHFDAGPVQRPTAKAPEVPLAVLVGPRGVHDLRLDVDDLAARHDVTVLGPARSRAVVVRFSDPDVGLWAQLLAFAHDVGPQRIASALGMDEDV